MHPLPYRTGTTWLSDADLIVLDVLWDGAAQFWFLRHQEFDLRINVPYSHDLDDDQLRCRLKWMCEHGVLETYDWEGNSAYCLTPHGGELWAQERCPVWDRYCRFRYTRSQRVLAITAVSAAIRDECLEMEYMHTTRILIQRVRRATISRHELLYWRTFPRLYVGLITYVEQPLSPLEKAQCWRGIIDKNERKRGWWETVGELQKFLPHPP